MQHPTSISLDHSLSSSSAKVSETAYGEDNNSGSYFVAVQPNDHLSITEARNISERNQGLTIHSSAATNSNDVQLEMSCEGASGNQILDQSSSPSSFKAKLSGNQSVVVEKVSRTDIKWELYVKDVARDNYYALLPAHSFLDENYDERRPMDTRTIRVHYKDFPSKSFPIDGFRFGREYPIRQEFFNPKLDIAAANVTQLKDILYTSGNPENGSTKILLIDEKGLNYMKDYSVKVHLKGKSETGYVVHLFDAIDDGYVWIRFEGDILHRGDVGTIVYVSDRNDKPYMLGMISSGMANFPVYGITILSYNIMELCRVMNVEKISALNNDEIFIPCDSALLESLKKHFI